MPGLLEGGLLEAPPLIGMAMLLLGIALSPTEPTPESRDELEEIAARASLG
ncbi:hypothetical protein STVA_18660 [Allostella vacuolata]|nr:hypothetical protein STVA_18660 [Stella vacuolata]